MRLIDADEFRELIDGGYDLNFDDVPNTKKELLRMIDNAPTVEPIKVGDVCKECWREGGNAVQVVRCKDCRFHEQEQPGMVYCPATVGGWVEENWFCKGGERRSE